MQICAADAGTFVAVGVRAVAAGGFMDANGSLALGGIALGIENMGAFGAVGN